LKTLKIKTPETFLILAVFARLQADTVINGTNSEFRSNFYQDYLKNRIAAMAKGLKPTYVPKNTPYNTLLSR
jgi:hypothetical protein